MKQNAGRHGSLPTLPVADRDHILGEIDAPIKLLEYGDYECPACGAAYPEVKQIQRYLGARLCFSFRNFPLVNSHPHAEHAAEIAEASAPHGRFWEMHDALFENQDALEDPHLADYATELGLNGDHLLSEVLSGAHSLRVREDFSSGAHNGVNGTPTLFVNGLRYNGEATFEGLISAIRAATG